MAQMLLKGWPSNEASALWEKRVGIMLTAVVPGTPAAFASLRPGDVILRVNENDVRSALDFSALLGQCEAATPVKFTVAKPNHASPQAVTVKLTDAFNFAFKMELERVAPRSAGAATADSLAPLGIETLAFGPRAAARLRAQSGLLVVWVKPESIAYRGGVREGDVIETIDSRVIAQRRPEAEAVIHTSKTVVLGIVRDGQRINITVQKPDEKKTEEKKTDEKKN
jgi:serine protease Do